MRTPVRKSANEQQTLSQTAEGQTNNEASQKKRLPSLFSRQLKHERKLLLKSILRIEILIVIVLEILSLYWGGVVSRLPNQRLLTVALVDFDGGEVGRALTQFGTIHGNVTNSRDPTAPTDATNG